MATHWTLGCDAVDDQLGHVVMLDPEGNVLRRLS
jgi:hypothetical protein